MMLWESNQDQKEPLIQPENLTDVSEIIKNPQGTLLHLNLTSIRREIKKGRRQWSCEILQLQKQIRN